MNNQAYSVPQFLEIFQLGRTKAYEEISSGRLVTYRVGRRRFISHRAADEWQRELEATNCLLERPTEPILADPAGAMKLAGGGVSTAYPRRDAHRCVRRCVVYRHVVASTPRPHIGSRHGNLNRSE
jgi:hypothetical protein